MRDAWDIDDDLQEQYAEVHKLKDEIAKLKATLTKARECLSMTHHQGQDSVDWADEIIAEIDEVLK